MLPSSAKAGDSALEALVDAAAGILSADSLPGTLGRIAHHLATLVPFDDLSLYEIEDGGDSLKPVFAVGDWVEEIMAEEIPVLSGVTGWVVRNRRTRNVPNTLHEPLCTVVTGTDEVAEAFVAVPLIAHDRVVGSLNVYRTGRRRPVHRRGGRARRALRDDGRAGLRLRPAARPAARGGPHGQPHRPAQPPRQPGAPARRARRGRRRGRCSVVVIDLDHFKRINDTFGHAEGDRALALAAAALRDVVRETDAVGRLGGEEFVLVLPGVDAAAAREAAERARVAISEVQIGGRQLACSAGLACHPDDAADAPGLLMAADAALYAAKDTRPRAHLPLPPEPRAAARRPARSARRSRRSCATPTRASAPPSSPCSSSPPAASPATRRSPASTSSPSAAPTSGSPRRTASGSAPSSRRPRCAPRSPCPAAPPARSWRST